MKMSYFLGIELYWGYHFPKKRNESLKGLTFEEVFKDSRNHRKNTTIYTLTSAKQTDEWLVDKTPIEKL